MGLGVTRRGLGAIAMLAATAWATGATAQQGQPLRVGSTLALTGPLAATGIVHKIVGEIYVEQLN
ncbi:MAG TPA: ABC transporter substrate-binding protein, partial [Alphaproteobacteria bacterium]|nr:ABC transporter substrate-binding protein [Alphaproteobacteria bacterium]